MTIFKSLTIVAFLALSISGCSNAERENAISQYEQAKAAGNLEEQVAAVELLLLHDKDKIDQWQKKHSELKEVGQYNQQAEQMLAETPFEALKLAVKADELAYNKTSRDMVVDIIKPYQDFAKMYKPMREWAYPPFEKMLTKGTLGEGFKQWALAAEIPTLWPDNMLVEVLASKNTEPFKLAFELNEERNNFNEVLILTTRMARNNADDYIIKALDYDSAIINGMYNAVFTDWHWHYIRSALSATLTYNDSLIEKARSNAAQGQTDAQWREIFEPLVADLKINLNACCIKNQKKVAGIYQFIERPGPYDNEVEQLSQHYAQWIEQNFTLTDTRAAYVSLLNQQSQKISATIAKIDALSSKLNRKDLAGNFLHVTYAWHNNSFHQLEALIPIFRHYKSSIRGY